MVEKIHKTADGSVHYWMSDALGPDAAWFVFVPGLTADHTLFAPQLAYFETRANCLVWDAPAHAASRPYPLTFTLDDYARILHDILQAEGIRRPVYVGQSLGGFVGQAFMDLYPGAVSGFVSVDSGPLQRSYFQNWELSALEHTYAMYLGIPWRLLVAWACRGAAATPAGRQNMAQMMSLYSKVEYCRLTAHGFAILAHAARAERAYRIDCPALLLCGERDHAGSTRRYNKMWHERAGLPLEWIPGAGHNSTIDAPEYVNACIEEFAAHLR